MGVSSKERVRWGRRLAMAMGVSCSSIGTVHALTGARSVVGLTGTGPNEDSQERFYGALFAAYGGAWIRAARSERASSQLVEPLAAGMILGGLARIVGILSGSKPHRFWQVMTAVEIVVPPIIVWLHRAGSADGRGAPLRGAS